jgi:hypothetical protein
MLAKYNAWFMVLGIFHFKGKKLLDWEFQGDLD